MIDEKYYLRRLAKVLSDEYDKFFWFDIEKYIRLAAKYDFKPKNLRIQIECAEEEKDIPSEKTIGRVLGYFNAEIESGKDKAIEIKTAKALGKALCDGDEYGLLIPITKASIMSVVKQAEELWGTSDINYIYGLMNTLLYELEVSSFYSYKPGTEEKGFDYYDMRLQTIRQEIDSRFWQRKNIRDNLYRLVEEEEDIIKSCSHPYAPKRWIEANPKLKFYDCVFDFIEESPELYELIKRGKIKTGQGLTISFNFYPTGEECQERREYFADLHNKAAKRNYQYTYDRYYQNELVDAFRIVFESEFA